MKTKDIVLFLAAGLIFVVTGIVAYGQFAPKSSASSQVTVEVVDPIESQFDQTGLKAIGDPAQVRDFAVPIDLNGLGNPTPFGKR